MPGIAKRESQRLHGSLLLLLTWATKMRSLLLQLIAHKRKTNFSISS
jgi:hypothetical protein